MLTLDASFGLLGGYTALIWSSMAILVGWYQEFSFSNELGK